MQTSWLDQHRHWVFLIITLFTLMGGGYFYWEQSQPTTVELIVPISTPTATVAPTATPAPLRVYITGAVAQPDVYYLPPNSIVKDLIAAAGGLTAEAADLKMFNQAMALQDQQHVHIPLQDEEDSPPFIQDEVSQPETAAPATQSSGLININTATLSELDSLPRIGPVLSQNIIDYRESQGGFKTVTEIQQVSGIGESTFAQIKEFITVE